jgi:5'-3' exonuclease
MLIDGKNAVYRALFAGYSDRQFRKKGHDYFVILIRFVSNYISLFRPASVHIFWDAPRSKIWRKQVVDTYKDHRTDKYKELDIDIHKELARQIKVAIKVFGWLNCRQYYRVGMEADDLIYAFCSVSGDDTIIVSSDQDFRQITQKMDHVHLYNPLAKKQQVEPRPTEDIVVMKSLMGDKSDNLAGYYNIGPKRSTKLASDLKARTEFLESDKAVAMIDGKLEWVGDKIFKRNRKIIDLAWCPEVSENCEYVENKMTAEIRLDIGRVKSIAQKDRIRGLLADLQRYTRLFKAMV